MEVKIYANNMIELMGLAETIRVIKLINTDSLKTTPDIYTTNKKKQSMALTSNLKTARFFENVKGYLKNKLNEKK